MRVFDYMSRRGRVELVESPAGLSLRWPGGETLRVVPGPEFCVHVPRPVLPTVRGELRAVTGWPGLMCDACSPQEVKHADPEFLDPAGQPRGRPGVQGI